MRFCDDSDGTFVFHNDGEFLDQLTMICSRKTLYHGVGWLVS